MNRAFIKPYAKFILNIELFRKVVLVKLRVNEISQCRRSHQRVGHVQNSSDLVSYKGEPGFLGDAESTNDARASAFCLLRPSPGSFHCERPCSHACEVLFTPLLDPFALQ